MVKSRLAVLTARSAEAVQAHLRYIAREGVSRDSERGVAYDTRDDGVDLAAFEQRGRGDRHQFRFIVAPEDAAELEDLQRFTRELMEQMEVDLGSRLDWVAVDHWNTDNPHTHVVLRGRHQAGHDLVIAREYITHGMRHRASELATDWLGPRSEIEIAQSTAREVSQERWTSLDRVLVGESRDGVVDLSRRAPTAQQESRRLTLIGRLQRLEGMGLAEDLGRGRWKLRPDLERTLRAAGERHDIVRAMQRAFSGQQRELAVFDSSRSDTIVVGRIAAKGTMDGFHDRPYLVVDGLDGRGHYVSLASGASLDEWPVGGIVEAQGTRQRVVDRNVVGLLENGIYRTEHHLRQLRARQGRNDSPDDIVERHVRRLEAMRRAGIVERLAEGVWRVPKNLVECGRTYDAQRLGEASVQLRSHLPIDRQVTALGATWLDEQLVSGQSLRSSNGFPGEVMRAVAARKEYLVENGFGRREGQRFVPVKNLLGTLQAHELDNAGAAWAAKHKLAYRRCPKEGRISGVYRRSVTLVSGRFAMLDDGIGFSLVPWQRVIDKRIGQAMSASIQGIRITWTFGRSRGLSIGG
jgi:type IV secretory pathway VirD2 relaxase